MGEVDVDRNSIAMYVGHYLSCQNPSELKGSKADVEAMARWSPGGVETVARELAVQMTLCGKDCVGLTSRVSDIMDLVRHARSGRACGAAKTCAPPRACNAQRGRGEDRNHLPRKFHMDRH
ncbi:MAG: hypothetical protein PHQ80_02485 [Candidatus ainarchaeum sp.]|nr:hypothetical protein [Candidatus ainarchaeum sp.]MDD5096363.1 hypothetical protein [Candidatus ainarchaeum sp.]